MDDYENNFIHLGEWKGKWSTEEAQSRFRGFWENSGVDGAAWLLERLDTNVYSWEADAVVSALLAVGEPALPLVVRALKTVSSDKLLVLLKVLVYELSYFSFDQFLEEILTCLDECIQDDDEDIREQAYTVLTVLPKKVALPLLQKSIDFEQERDDSIIEVLTELLKDTGFKLLLSIVEED